MFQFPSNGKVYPKFNTFREGLAALKGFNSLQTGKCIQSHETYTAPTPLPSVSIPFKRESVSKAKGIISELASLVGFNSLQTGKCIQSAGVSSNTRILGSFNSLQTGKCIQSSTESDGRESVFVCFNSLQTGKCIQRNSCKRERREVTRRVSIPFKRESVSKGQLLIIKTKNDKFQFPSNGKVYTKLYGRYDKIEIKVSIPFKRESVSKVSYYTYI